MRDAVINSFGARSFDARPGPDGFRGVGSLVRLVNLDLNFCSYSTTVRISFRPDGLVRQQFSLSGSARTSFGRFESMVAADATCVIPAPADTSVDFGAGYAQLVLRIDQLALQHKLATLTGEPVGRPIEFKPASHFDNPKLSTLRRTIQFLADEIDRGGDNFPEQARVEYDQLLMALFLTANPHNLSHLLTGETSAAAPWQVRAAEEYIEANWNGPIQMEDIVEATGVAGRSLFRAFKKARGYSPMEFAKMVRLKHARRMLQLSDRNTSVSGVAFLCGFANLSHFAHDYRIAFGELPSATLEASRLMLRQKC